MLGDNRGTKFKKTKEIKILLKSKKPYKIRLFEYSVNAIKMLKVPQVGIEPTHFRTRF